MKRNGFPRSWHWTAQLLFGVTALAVLTLVCFRLELNLATTAFAYLILIVLLSLTGSIIPSVALCIIAVGCLSYFFAPPIFEFRVDSAQDAAALIAFLVTSLVVAGLVRRARTMGAKIQQTQAELARVARVTTLGELTASIAHEVNQPIAAVVTNAGAGLRWLAAQPPDLDEARQTFERIIKAGNRASDVISRIRALVKKAPVLKDRLDINETILEVVALTRSEGERHRVSLQTQLAGDLPLIPGDRIQLQQVILNLIVNALEAVSGVSEGPRELLITSGKDAAKGVLVAVRDSGTGLDSVGLERVFEAFYTTKPDGMGMGLAISRSIIEAHGGRLWATPNVPRGAVFWFTLAVEDRSSPPVVDDGSASTD